LARNRAGNLEPPLISLGKSALLTQFANSRASSSWKVAASAPRTALPSAVAQSSGNALGRNAFSGLAVIGVSLAIALAPLPIEHSWP